MTPEEMKGKLDEVDAKLREALAQHGFTPEEIARQLDPSIPTEVKEAEREAALRRHVANELSDPNSALFNAAIDEAARMGAQEIARLDAERRRKRITQAVLALAVIGVAVWYFVLRDTRSTCEKLLPSRADVASLAKLEIKPDVFALANGDYYCSASYRSPAGEAMTVYWEERADFARERDGQLKRPFASRDVMKTARGVADLFFAGDPKDDVRGDSPEELMAKAKARVGKSRDPIGDVLASSAPSSPESHVVILRDGSGIIKIEMKRDAFTPESARKLVKLIADR